MTMVQAEKRLGFRIRSVKAISVDTMLTNTKYSFGRECPDAILKTKERVYDNIVEYLAIEGYPTEGDPDFKEANINHLVYATISPVLGNFIRMTGRKSIQLRSEKEIVSPDGETGGLEEFVMVDLVSVEDEKFVLIVEAKRSSLGVAMKQCLLAMKDMRAINGGVDEVYGFVTTGESWRMISYDGKFQMTNKMDVMFDTMDEDKNKWMKDHSILVDCMYAALNRGTPASGERCKPSSLDCSDSNQHHSRNDDPHDTNSLDDTEDTMGDENTNQKKRKSKWNTSYLNMTIMQAEQRLGFRIRSLKGIPVQRMLAIANQGESLDDILTTKEKVYDRILEYLQIEGYPTEGDPDFKESNINHLVYATITPILSDFIRKTGRVTVQLRSEKEIVSTDGETGGTEEFAVLDLISVKEERFILIIEAKRSSLGQAMKQCLLAMKDMRDSNGGGKVYGFVTTGEQWQMLEYDGTSFRKTNIMIVVFDSMDDEKEKWLKENSILVDCIRFALNNGGIVKND